MVIIMGFRRMMVPGTKPYYTAAQWGMTHFFSLIFFGGCVLYCTYFLKKGLGNRLLLKNEDLGNKNLENLHLESLNFLKN